VVKKGYGRRRAFDLARDMLFDRRPFERGKPM
jgi:hypothetical protein